MFIYHDSVAPSNLAVFLARNTWVMAAEMITGDDQ